MTDLVDETLLKKPVDAATVILLRDHNNTLQTLLLCRGNSRTVMNSAWVFPGGKVDPQDLDQADKIQRDLPDKASTLLNEPDADNSLAAALFNTACRETWEETGVSIYPSRLQTWSRWITPNEPSIMKKRFDARFFVATLPDGQTASHDGTEATDSRWTTPAQALSDYIDGSIVLAPPQIMTLIALNEFDNTKACLDYAQRHVTYRIKPHVIKTPDTRILTYPGDAEHPETEQQMPGPTRLVWTQGRFEPPDGFRL